MLFSLVSFTSLYLIIGGITVYLFVRIIKGHENKKAKQDSQSHDPFDKEDEYVILNELWFIIIAILFVGFFVLEGFDFGVGIVSRFLGENDLEKRIYLNHNWSILARE